MRKRRKGEENSCVDVNAIEIKKEVEALITIDNRCKAVTAIYNVE